MSSDDESYDNNDESEDYSSDEEEMEVEIFKHSNDSITYHPEMLEEKPINLNVLSSDDIRYICQQYELSRDDINMDLYEICPEFFTSVERKIQLSRYPRLAGRVDSVQGIERALELNERIMNGMSFGENDVWFLWNLDIIRGPVPLDMLYHYVRKNKFTFPIYLAPKLLERIERIKKLAPSIKQYISNVSRRSIEDYPFYSPLPNEEFLFSLNDVNVKEHATAIGMIIPLIFQDRPVEYYLNNVDHYKHVNPKSKITHRQPDGAIFKSLGVYIPYTSRTQLLGLVEEYNRFDGRVIFTMQNSSLMKRAANKEISTMETLKELVESKERIICLGNFKSFSCFTYSELYHLWDSNFNHKKYVYSYPYDVADEMTETIYNRIILLLRCYGMEKEYLSLDRLYNQIKSNKIALIGNEREHINEFKQFNDDIKLKIKHFLTVMFECGMYFRRWKGKGHPYPIKSEQTEDNKIDPFVLATPHLNEMKDILKQIPWLEEIKIVNSNIDGYYITDDNIGRYFHHVYDGNICIRMASSKFVTTAERTLRLLFGEGIPGFVSSMVDQIS